jgi:hypothetical protein
VLWRKGQNAGETCIKRSFIICMPARQYMLLYVQIKEDETYVACNMHGKEEKRVQNFHRKT